MGPVEDSLPYCCLMDVLSATLVHCQVWEKTLLIYVWGCFSAPSCPLWWILVKFSGFVELMGPLTATNCQSSYNETSSKTY